MKISISISTSCGRRTGGERIAERMLSGLTTVTLCLSVDQDWLDELRSLPEV